MSFAPLYTILCLLIISCTTTTSVNSESKINPPEENLSGSQYTGTLIEKTFVNKGGKEFNHIKELYFKLSAEEIYFIKYLYTEGSVTANDLRPYINKPITILGEIKEGLWDVTGDSPPEAQSRIGKYIIIYRIE
jgi:hypothetical protein